MSFNYMEVSAFLSDLGLKQYIAAFTENGFETIEELKELTNEEFKEVGVKLAHRKKIQKGITAYSTTKSHPKKAEESKENEEEIENEDTDSRYNPLVVCV
eukprot:492534_1